jgi:hypothetical protein
VLVQVLLGLELGLAVRAREQGPLRAVGLER